MKKISQRKTGILICILAAVCILAVSVQVQAASKKVIFAKANGSVKITLEKKDSSWHLTTGKKEKDKQLLASKIVYVKFSKESEFSTGYYAFNKKGILDTRRTFHVLDTKIGDVRKPAVTAAFIHPVLPSHGTVM